MNTFSDAGGTVSAGGGVIDVKYARESDFNTLLTVRGAILLAFLAFLFYSPILKETDIIAAVITYTLSAYILLLIIGTIYFAKNIRNNLVLSIFQPESLETPGSAYSNSSALLVIKSEEIFIPPGYYLEIQVIFQNGDLNLSKHILSGRISKHHLLREYVTFPHRGYWHVGRINLSLADKLNLTSFNWSFSENIGNANPLVLPKVSPTSTLPILSSSNRSGDALPDLHEKNGDPYDLKAYHPSDGMKKILWKVYAKSGELISRHPEASMTPEGQVLVFSCVGKYDEEIASSVLAYLKVVEGLNLEILFSCLGADLREPVRTAALAQELMIDSVWQSEDFSEHALKRDLGGLIDVFRRKSSEARLDRIAIFIGKSRLSTEEGQRFALALGEYLDKLGISPFFCLISKFSINNEPVTSNIFERLFLNSTNKQKAFKEDLYYDFLSICKNKNWHYEEETVE